MGLFKKISRAVSKAFRAPLKIVKNIVKAPAKAVNSLIKGVKHYGKKVTDAFKIKMPEMPEMPEAPPPIAQAVGSSYEDGVAGLELGADEGSLRKRKKRGRAGLRIDPQFGGAGLGNTGVNVPMK